MKNRSSLMLKYQKAKVKLLEYEVPENQWPDFKLNYKDLAFPTVLALSRYAENINEGNNIENANSILQICSEFYDAALQSREQRIHDSDFALAGATAYFFMDNFGSAKVLWKAINKNDLINEQHICLFDLFSLAFRGRVTLKTDNLLCNAVLDFWKYGDFDSLQLTIEKYRNDVYQSESPDTLFFGEIVCAITKIICESSSRILLPVYSDIDINNWEKYLKRRNSINLLWASQKLIGQTGILKGENAILELPTGVGKTKSIELIIWSMFLSNRGKKALIVAPLRSLCNEITIDMRNAFPEDITINQFSDVLEDDFVNILLGNIEKQILICTPEKLQYIFHHDREFLNAIDLLIFDESHMFDDRSRGALYELLITDIKIQLRDTQQLVLMSAVLPNAEQILSWVLDGHGVLAYDSAIRSTPKAVGFTDRNNQVHYYSTDDDEDYFVPHTINNVKLNSLGRERKARMFPETSLDIALYYSNILCKAGGIAIYFGQKRSIPKLFDRLSDLEERGYFLNNISTYTNQGELEKIIKLFVAYYGPDNVYSKTIKYGILPHYSTLPNGLKISTEYAFRNNLIKAVACTSTLAQGVNIPIKYLLITGTNNSSNTMSVRNFQNLIGRTGRSGVYTTGDIIVTNSDIYEGKEKGRGYYRWKETRTLFDSSSIESCGSSILNIVRNFELGYSVEVYGSFITDYICENIHMNWDETLVPLIMREAVNIDENININQYKLEVIDRISNYKISIDTIENEIVYMLYYHPLSISTELLKSISDSLLKNTLAYYLADDNEKELLTKLFDAIVKNIDAKIGDLSKYSRAMISISDSDAIIKWIEENDINDEKKKPKDLLVPIEALFQQIYKSYEIKEGMALAWVRGDSYEKMSNEFDIKVQAVEKICHYSISYQMSFLVGNIIDILNADCVNLEGLKLLQQALRYGVNNKTAISICEKVFYDR